jgi:hypothetical protein
MNEGCCVDITAPPYNVRYTLPGETPKTDYSGALNRAISDVAEAGGGTIPIRGWLGIADSIRLRSGVRLEGGGLARYTHPPRDGTWIFWIGDAPGTMIQIGRADQTETLLGAAFAGIGLYGGLRPDGTNRDITFFDLVSNSTQGFATKDIRIERVVCAIGARGVRWGTIGVPELQVDNVLFEQCAWYHMSEYGVKTGSANSGDASVFRQCTFSDCAPDEHAYIDLEHSGSIAFEHCSFGGDGRARKDAFRITPTTNRIILYHCFGEKMRYWINHGGHGITVTMIGCVVGDDIIIDGIGSVLSYGSKIRANIYLEHPGSSYQAFDDDFETGSGVRVVKDPSATLRNVVPRAASPYGCFYEGQILADPRTGAHPSKLDRVCVRSGRAAAGWSANEKIEPEVRPERSWVPTAEYAQDDLVTPTWGNGLVYKCKTAGKSGSEEPKWKRFVDPDFPIDDGSCAWVLPDPAISQPVSKTIYRQPTEDNGHVYKAIRAGTTGGSEPEWPTGPGSTVADGGVVWQETGASALWVDNWIGGLPLMESAPASTPGTVVQRLTAYDENGQLIGYVPIYDKIT